MTLADYLFADDRAHGVGDVIFVCTLTGTPYVLGRVTRTLVEQKALLDELGLHPTPGLSRLPELVELTSGSRRCHRRSTCPRTGSSRRR